jgi:hypothetical protein
MSTNSIDNWFGRLGNNIQQVSNAIYYCKTNNTNFYPRSHPLINLNKISFGEDRKLSNRFFFYDGKEKDFDCNVEKLNLERREICLKYITPNFNFHVQDAFDDDIVIIHIRGGDVFWENPPNTYVQNPLSFYLKIIERFQLAIVVTEDTNNIILQNIRKHPKVIIQNSSIQNDFATLMRAKNLVTSGVGTFAIAAALCSKNIQNLYYTNLYLNEHLNPTMLYSYNINLHLTELKNYIKIGEWKNSSEQIEKMLFFEE